MFFNSINIIQNFNIIGSIYILLKFVTSGDQTSNDFGNKSVAIFY